MVYLLIITIAVESFECFSIEEIKRELSHYKKMIEIIQVDLFVCRNADGSPKECQIFEEIMNIIYNCNELMEFEKIDNKSMMLNLNLIVEGIKDLQCRKYKNQFYTYEDTLSYDEHNLGYGIESSNQDFDFTFHLEYVERKKSGSRKKKKR